MKVLRVVNIPTYHGNTEKTLHITERNQRIRMYIDNFGRGIPIHAFEVDKNHENGNEIHVVCHNRLVYIYNAVTEKLITVLYGRPAQLKRYYNGLGLDYNGGSYERYEEGWNEI